MDEFDELLAENAALRETLGRTLDALEYHYRKNAGIAKEAPIAGPPGSIIGDARRLLGRVK